MDHREARENLSAYLDGSLPAAGRARVEDHLGTCPDCRTELDDLGRLRGLLHAVPAVDPPRSFVLTPDLLRRPPTLQPAGETVRWLRPVRYLTAVAALFLIALLARDAFDLVNQGGAPVVTAPAAAPAPKTAVSSASETRTAGIPGPTPTAAVFGAKVERAPEPDATPAPPTRSSSEQRAPFSFGWLELLVAAIVVAGGLAWLAGARREAAERDVR